MQRVYQVHEIFRRAVAAGCGKIPCCLITPGAVIRVLAQGHQFHMGIVHFFHILYQRLRNVPVGHHLTRRVTFPGSQVNLINQHGVMVRIIILPAFLPCLVMPLVMQVLHNGSGIRAQFRGKPVGIAF